MNDTKLKFKRKGKTYYKIPCAYCETTIVVPHGSMSKITKCPHCSIESPWILKPITERKLFELQEEYMSQIDNDLFQQFYEEMQKEEEERDEDIIRRHREQMNDRVLQKMYNLVLLYTESLMKKMLKNKGFKLAPDEFQDKLYQAAFNWYKQFTGKPGHFIELSWAGQLKYKIIEALYSQKDDEQMDSLNRMVDDSQNHNNSSLLDVSESFHVKPMWTNQVEDPYEEIHHFEMELQKVLARIVESLSKKGDYRDMLITLIAFKYFVKRDMQKYNQILDCYGKIIKDNVESVQMILRRYLRNVRKN